MKKRQLLSAAVSLMLLSASATAQVPTIGWSKIYGGDRGESIISVAPTPDGGYITAGYTMSTPSGDISERIGGKDADYWVVKVNDTGKIEWEKVYGGYDDDFPGKIVTTTDGGYIVVGSSSSTSGDITNNLGSWDIWVVKLNDTGKIEWEKSFGGPDQDGGSDNVKGFDIKQTSDGGYIAVGIVNTHVMPGYGNGHEDLLVIKLSASGNVEWENPYGSSQSDRPGSIIETYDGGYFIAGMVGAADSNVTGTYQGEGDWWLLKLDNAGAIEWNKVLGGSQSEFPGGAVQVADSGYVIAGLTRSSDGDVVRNSPGGGTVPPNEDIWVVKIDKTGQNIVWNKAFGGTLTEDAIKIINTNDGGVLISGMTSSSDYGMPGDYANRGNDAFLLKLDTEGEREWTKSYGSTGQDYFYGTHALADGSYVAAGYASAQDLDIPTHDFGGEKFWILKLDAPDMDSIVVTTKSGIGAIITTQGGTLALAAAIYPRVLPQDVTWSITPGTGTATIDANGVVTAQTDGTVWGKAISVNNNTLADSIEIVITGQTVEPEPESVQDINGQTLPVHIYPNPAGNTVYLQMEGTHPALALNLINIDGKVVYNRNITANALQTPVQVNMTHLPAGIYLIRIDGDNVRMSSTVIKQ